MNNKKLFQISADFNLKTKPAWLHDFRLKYDLPYDYHITLKTTTNFEYDNFEKLNIELKNISNSYQSFEIIFDKLFIAHALHGWCIMIKAQYNKKIIELQKEIVTKFSKYGSHITKKEEDFENDFNPHITIARHLSSKQLEKAKDELKNNLICEATIDSLILTTMEKDIFEELSDPNNRIIYKFTK
ncbi:MAG: 2'-5' RNA ligase family protein [Candidatus Buchananbacteria bacterium]